MMLMNQLKILLALLVAALTMGTQLLVAGTTGKIAGLVTDAKSTEPILGVNVMITASWQNAIETTIRTPLGASSNIDGQYFILNVPPGVYTVEASSIGWRKIRKQNIRVQVDHTSVLNFEMEAETVEIGTVNVVAEGRQTVIKDLTSASAKISTEEIHALPVDNFIDVLSLQAGVTVDANGGLHVRGGRSSEIQYYVDGIAISNAFSNTLAIPIENNSIQELEVISGTFNAEYGDAMSAVVNIVTKEGTDRISGSLSAYVGDFFTNNKVFWGLDKHEVRQKNVEATFSAPIPGIPAMSIFVSGRWLDEKNQYYGQRKYNIYDSSYILGSDPSRWYIEHTGDGAMVPMAPLKSFSYNGKLTWKPSSMFKLNYSFLGNFSQYKSYDSANTIIVPVVPQRERYNPDYLPTTYSTNYGHIVKIAQTFSGSTFLNLNLSYYQDHTKRYVFEDPNDPRYAALFGRGAIPSDIFATGGVDGQHLDQLSKTYAVRIDLTSQVNFTHLLKGGCEYRYIDMSMEDYLLEVDPNKYGNYIPHIPPLTSANHDSYRRFPYQAALYLQDKIEINDFIINIGARYDYFNSQSVIPTDLTDPNNSDPSRIRPVDQAFEKVKAKQQLSPRLGFAFPITDRGVLHASYGQFFQIPPLPSLYQNPDFKILSGTLQSYVGNADLEPQRSAKYELGLQQQLSENILADVTAFYQDVRHLLGVSFEQYYQGGTTYGRYINVDYGGVAGLTVALNLVPGPGSYVSGSFDYTYQVAEGNGSDPLEALYDQLNGSDPTRVLIPLNWDVRHNITATMTLSNNVWGASVIGTFKTGFPFTPANFPVLRNKDRYISMYNINLQAFRNFTFGNCRFQIFARVENLFDTYTHDNLPVIDPLDSDAFNSNNFYLLNSIYDYRNNPSNYPMPRLVKIGVRIEY